MCNCSGLPFFNIAEVGITRPKWWEIKTAGLCKTLTIVNAEKESPRHLQSKSRERAVIIVASFPERVGHYCPPLQVAECDG
jgi:hypothetical protein